MGPLKVPSHVLKNDTPFINTYFKDVFLISKVSDTNSRPLLLHGVQDIDRINPMKCDDITV